MVTDHFLSETLTYFHANTNGYYPDTIVGGSPCPAGIDYPQCLVTGRKEVIDEHVHRADSYV